MEGWILADTPETHPKASVLASVKGTPEADEAVILASIPQTATVDRAARGDLGIPGRVHCAK